MSKIGTFREWLRESEKELNEASFKADKKNSMLYANGENRAYRIGISEDNISIFAASGFSNNFTEIKKIPYNISELSIAIKELRKQKEYNDIPSFSKAQEKQVDAIHFDFLKQRRNEKEIYNYWLK